MASNAKPPNLKEFKGSDQEEIIQKIFRVITTNPAFIPFINVEIHKSNAEDATSFSDAYITLRTTYDCMRRRNSKFVTETIPECEVVGMKELLNISILEQFCEGGVEAMEKYSHTEICQSFLVLLNYLREIECHERAIGKLLESNQNNTAKETQIMTGLAHHLFSQLVPSKKYEVDKFAKNLPKVCGCGCNSNICGGDTSLGSRGTWHGRVDIMVNHTIAVAIGKEPNDDGEEDDTDDEEPQKKHRKVEMDKECDICVEVKSNRRYDSVLLDPNVMKQILAEAITNGFAQVNRNKSTLSNFLIPTFGVTSDHVSICMYDPEYDCLLHIDDELELWASRGESQHQLDPVIIIIIWLFLNFTVFTKKNLASEANLQKSGLHVDLKESLQYYRETKAKAKFLSRTPEGRPWKLANKKFKQRITHS